MKIKLGPPRQIDSKFAFASLRCSVNDAHDKCYFDVKASFGEPISLEVDEILLPFYVKKAYFKLNIEAGYIDWDRCYGVRYAPLEYNRNVESGSDLESASNNISSSIGGIDPVRFGSFLKSLILSTKFERDSVAKSPHRYSGGYSDPIFAIEARIGSEDEGMGLWIIEALPGQHSLRNVYHFRDDDFDGLYATILIKNANRLGSTSLCVAQGSLTPDLSVMRSMKRLSARNRRDEAIFKIFLEKCLSAKIRGLFSTADVDCDEVPIWTQDIYLVEDVA